jgi:hypothetical protein
MPAQAGATPTALLSAPSTVSSMPPPSQPGLAGAASTAPSLPGSIPLLGVGDGMAGLAGPGTFSTAGGLAVTAGLYDLPYSLAAFELPPGAVVKTEAGVKTETGVAGGVKAEPCLGPMGLGLPASTGGEWEGVKESEPVTSLQLRLPSGRPLVARFNHTHTLRDVRHFLRAARPKLKAGMRAQRVTSAAAGRTLLVCAAVCATPQTAGRATAVPAAMRRRRTSSWRVAQPSQSRQRT